MDVSVLLEAQTGGAKDLPDVIFSSILSFSSPRELAYLELVCKNWRRFINSPGQWKAQCQMQLHVSIDPSPYLPKALFSKEGFLQLMSSSNILDENIYKYWIGNVGPVPPIPKQISPDKSSDPDPCDPTKTIGEEYVWMYCPSHIETTHLKGFYLDGPDDPKNPEAPRLVKSMLSYIGLGAKPETLKVPVTLNNVRELFQHPKRGNPSKYSFIWNEIFEQHGNKRIPGGWTCMKKSVIGIGLSFAEQQALAKEKGVTISPLIERILFNFLQHVRSGDPNTYPDGKAPQTIARTSTLISFVRKTDWPSGCGDGDPSGLSLSPYYIFDFISTGLSVALPVEVQVNGS
jgi:hypothetical protein